MNSLFLRTSLVLALVIASLGNQCTDGAPTAPPELLTERVEFLTPEGKKFSLTVIDYSTRDSAKGPFSETEISGLKELSVVPAKGSIVLGFSQFLDASIIETPVVDRQVGKGDWNNGINVVKEYTPKNDIVALNVIGRATQPTVNVAYRADGGVPIDPKEPVTKAPPPAITVEIDSPSATPPAEEVVVLHLFNNVKGISGKLIPAAQYADQKDVESGGKKIAATIVFRIQTPAP